MSLKEKLNLRFKRSQCFQLVLTHPDKSTSTHIVLRNDKDFLEYKEGRYMIVPEHVTYNRKLLIPVSFYHVNNTSPANPTTWTTESVSSQLVKKMMSDKIVQELQSTSSSPADLNQRLLYAVLAVLLIGLIMLGYLLWSLQTAFESSIINSEAFREWVQRQIAEGVFN